MAKVVKVIELLSESPKSWEDAAQSAFREASWTLRNDSFYLRQRDERRGRERTDHKLSTNSKVSLELEGARGGKK